MKALGKIHFKPDHTFFSPNQGDSLNWLWLRFRCSFQPGTDFASLSLSYEMILESEEVRGDRIIEEFETQEIPSIMHQNFHKQCVLVKIVEELRHLKDMTLLADVFC